MVKRHIVETVEEFNENGILVSRTTTTTDEEDDSKTIYQSQTIPVTTIMPNVEGTHWT